MKNILIILICILIAAVSGGGVYFWQKSEARKQNEQNQNTISSLQSQTSDLQKQITELQKNQKIPTDKKTCEEQGGKWGQIGLNPKKACNLPTTDASKVCNDTKDCQGTCLADQNAKLDQKASGTCSEWKIIAGCFKLIEGGMVQQMCID